jgi:hypothetical protein
MVTGIIFFLRTDKFNFSFLVIIFLILEQLLNQPIKIFILLRRFFHMKRFRYHYRVNIIAEKKNPQGRIKSIKTLLSSIKRKC